MKNKYISTTQYAKQAGISRMHAVRLIKEGKLPATKVGKSWMIEMTNTEQSGLEKTTSLQKWNKLINQTLDKNLDIEDSKDREIIYARINGLGLPHERCLGYDSETKFTKKDLIYAVNKLGLPYWISLVPGKSKEAEKLNRLSKLGIHSIDEGWGFLNKVTSLDKYKIILAQYPSKVTFKGTALISKTGLGVAEFVTGDRHYIMTRGFTITDPMLFDKNKIIRYSEYIEKKYQQQLFTLLNNTPGHFEFQYGTLAGVKGYSFFDYNKEAAYLSINQIWSGLKGHYTSTFNPNSIVGLPASLGKVKGKAVVVHHESYPMLSNIEEGCILVSDTTTPDMTVLMGKVKAVVTDLGGVTSHAAIVCRELQIPAVVGTKNATEKISNGDFLEVDASNGVIKILNKA